MKTRTGLQVAHTAATLAIGYQLIKMHQELRVHRKWIVTNAVDAARVENLVQMLRKHGHVDQVRVRRSAP